MLEAQFHSQSSFATFTFEKEPSDGSIRVAHISSTLHRLRDRLREESRKVRFFAVGEYGEQFGRPHYHAALFGVSPQEQDVVAASWNSLVDTLGAVPGFVHLGTLTPNSAGYVAGYVVKKIARGQTREDGRVPEFAVMSRRPGIGLVAVPALIEALNTSHGALYLARNKDVPVAIQINGKLMPLGRYIRTQLRLFFFGEETQPKAAKEFYETQFFENNMPFVPPNASPTLRKIAAAYFDSQAKEAHQLYTDTLMQKGRQLKARHDIQRSLRKL